jgi:hypothetical protein
VHFKTKQPHFAHVESIKIAKKLPRIANFAIFCCIFGHMQFAKIIVE